MFFAKRRAAERQQEIDLARANLAKWGEALGDAQRLPDAGEKYYRLLELEKRVSDTLGYPTLRDAAEAVTPAAKKSVWKWEATGTTAIVGGSLLCLGGGPLGISFGGTMIIYGALGCAAGGQRAVANRRNGKIYRGNQALFDDLNALRENIRTQAQEVLTDLESHPEKIAQSSRVDALLNLRKLHDAFTAAATERMKEKAPPRPADPGRGGFHL